MIRASLTLGGLTMDQVTRLLQAKIVQCISRHPTMHDQFTVQTTSVDLPYITRICDSMYGGVAMTAEDLMRYPARIPLQLMAVGVGGRTYIECRLMVSGGRACGHRWTIDEANSEMVLAHLQEPHP